jgi:ferredoxin/flavodoxin---NADP+ reductase
VPYKILKKVFLDSNETLFEMVLETPLIAKKAHAGNFILIRVNEKGERIPLTIADYDKEKGTITIVVQVVGKTTTLLSQQKVGDTILDVVGPLGNKIHIKEYDHPIVIVGGGVGIAPCYPQAKELKEVGNRVITIMGARNRDLHFWIDKFTEISDKLIITTNDGSLGMKGLVIEPLKEILKSREISLVIAIGPLIMMKSVVELTKGIEDFPKVDTMVSLNTIMIDGTGMCGGCRFLTQEGEIYFACVDGPDVDGHIVNFENLMERAKRYADQEQKALETYKHKCRSLEKFKSENPKVKEKGAE